MIFHVLSLFPEAYSGFLSCSIIGKAVERGLIKVNLIDIRDFARDKHRTCDDATYGGGPGMVLKSGPLAEAIESTVSPGKPVIYMSPSGKLFNQQCAESLSREGEVVLICGHYEGIDQRIIDKYVTDEISVGDYILSSGVSASMIVIDAVSRLVDGVINAQSHEEESFSRGLLEYPQYTRPEIFSGMQVPEVLMSGHHANINRWRLEQSLKKTLRNRPELIEKLELNKEERKLLNEIIRKEGEDNGLAEKT